MFGLSGGLAVLQFVGMLPMPESPKWLQQQGRHEESEAALARIRADDGDFRGDDDAIRIRNDIDPATTESHTRSIATSYEAVTAPSFGSAPDISTTAPSASNSGLIGRFTFYCCQLVYLLQQLLAFAKETLLHYKRQLYIALFLSVTQQFCGQTNVLSYAPLIFSRAAAASSSSDTNGQQQSAAEYVQGWSTLSIGLVKFVVTVIVIWKIEAFGRRNLLLVGMATIAFGLLLLAIAFTGEDLTPVSVGGERYLEQKGEDYGAETNGVGLAMPGILLVVCGYSMSFGPLTWLLTSELFPTELRGRALGFSTIVTYMCGALVTFTFLSAQEQFGATAVFCFYLLVTSLGFVFAFTAVPDTKEKSPEEIGEDLDKMLWWQGIRRARRGREGDTSPLFGPVSGVNGDESGVKVPETELT